MKTTIPEAFWRSTPKNSATSSRASMPPAKSKTSICPDSASTPLRGDRRGYWAITVRANWRVTFRMADGEATDIDYIDDH